MSLCGVAIDRYTVLHVAVYVTKEPIGIEKMCYIYILQDRTCSEVYDIGDKYIIGYI